MDMADSRRSRMRGRPLLLVVLALVAAACSGGEGTEPIGSAPTGPPPTPLPTIATTDVTVVPDPGTVEPPATTVAFTDPLRDRLVLLPDGLGAVSFGEPMDEVLQSLTGFLGPPEDDQVFSAPWAEGTSCAAATGYGCGDYLRIVEWRNPLLTAVFLDTSADSAVTFAGWVYGGGIGLATPDGVTAAMTIDEVRQALGDRLQEPTHPDRCTGDWDAFTDDGIGLRLTADPQAETTRVSLLFAGEAFGAC